MKVTICVTRSDTIGGVHVYLFNLISTLQKAGYLPEVVCSFTPDSPFLSRLKSIGVNHVLCPHLYNNLNPLADLKAFLFLFSHFRSLSPDTVIHIHSSKVGFLARIAAFLAGRKSIFTVHGWSFNSVKSKHPIFLIYVFLERILCFLPVKMIFVCYKDLELAFSYRFPLHRFQVILNSVKPSHFVRNTFYFNQSPSPLKLLSVGRLEEQKGYHVLFFALSKLKFTNWELHMVGDGPLRVHLMNLATKLGINSKILFHGYHNDPSCFYKQSDLFVLSSLWEGLPMTILEAFSYSLPVLCSDVGGCSDIVLDGFNGFIVPPNDVSALASAITHFADTHSSPESLSKGAYYTYLHMFAYDIWQSKIIDVLRSLS